MAALVIAAAGEGAAMAGLALEAGSYTRPDASDGAWGMGPAAVAERLSVTRLREKVI